ncbi:PREDICTED: cilia- and flagella-associated protein 46-like [Amphimedon queenslandica]|uniref:Uncharacterized protein n=1 Tax=Amphimedon queenslandica TaxID=400682 RepID=A0AAN0JUY8_AMPQE|nr:PREDICTED: cilia- and flagella-associated protein 46-like [Amphimedon queenslandica]XP_019860952.1 PREDICTED: cilia- and flagella-associated protein 46-like [Amphimedon queenslandica]|eukprot:XP_019860951.1 PREDICTED: cilia- and flagella-associated protein 46-like [Amphimedon queenslandica]
MAAQSYEEMFFYLRETFSPENRKPMVETNVPQLVLFAEHILKDDNVDLAMECIDFYFSLNPPANQFLIRAHVCRGMCLSRREGREQESLRCFSKASWFSKEVAMLSFHGIQYISVSVEGYKRRRSNGHIITSGLHINTTDCSEGTG